MSPVPGGTPWLRIDDKLQVTSLSPTAQALIDRLSAIRIENGRLALRRGAEMTALRAALQNLGVAPGARPRRPARQPELPPGKALVLLRSREGAPVLMLVLNVTAEGDVLAVLAELEGAPPPEPATLARLFGLTAAEARIVSLVTAGSNPTEAAETLSVSPETVRGHLKSAMRKLGVRSQAQMATRILRAMAAWEF